MKKDVLENFTEFTGRPAALLKRGSGTGAFLSKDIFFTEHLWTTASGRRYCIDNFVM